MSEIQEFLSPQAQKQVEQYKKDLEEISKDYASIAKSVDKLDKEQKQESRTQKELTTRQKEALKLQKQLRSTTAKREQANSKLNKELVKQKVALQEQNKAIKEQARQDLGLKKRTTLFQSMTKSILAAGVGFLSINVAVKAGTKLLKTMFLGTQDNIDFFNQKLEGVKAQFAVLSDNVSNFGDKVVKAFSKDGAEGVSAFTIAYIALASTLGISTKKIAENAIEMEKRRKEAELLQKMMNELNEKEVEYIGTRADLRQEMQLNRLEAKKAGDNSVLALSYIEKAITAEKTLMDLESTFTKERSRIATERLDLSISTRQDRKEAAIFAAAVTDIETKSIKKLATLESERLSFLRKIARERTDNTRTEIKELEGLEKKTIESVNIGIEGATELTITQETLLDRQKKAQEEYDAWYLQSQKDKWANAQEYVSMFSGYAVDAINGIFNFQIDALDNELDATDAYYQTKINAASNAGENTVQLESEYNLKRQQIEDEKKKREKQAAIVSIGLTYAQSAFEIIANAAALSSNPLTIALSPLAWSQLGALTIAQGVQLAAVSQFDNGTGSTPSTYIAGEKRPEFRKHNGQWSLLTEPTLFTDSAGDQIISGAETDQILKGASMQGNTGNSAIDTERIVRAIENNTPSMGISKGGLISVSKKNGSITKYLNENVRH